MALRAWTLAIDFGTTATVAAVQIDGERPEILEIGGDRRLPSIVFIDDDGSIVVGQAAAGLAISRPDRAIRAPKGRLGEQVPIVLAGEAHQAVDLVSAVLASVLTEASRFVGGPPARTRLTYPATWNRPRRSRLLEAAAKAGLPEPELIAEPVAAALTYSQRGQLPDDGHVAVYDLGGGTFDTAVLQATSGGFRVIGRPHGDPQLGGELFDEMLMNLVGERLDEDRWDELVISEEPEWRRAAARLRRECRRVKEALSTHGYGEIVMGLPDGMVEERVTKEELEQLVRPFIDESVSLLGQCIGDAGVSPNDLEAIYITGGASRMPMVEAAVRDAFPNVAISRQGDPKTAVAFGALVASPASMDASLASGPDRSRAVPPTPTVPPRPSEDLRSPAPGAVTPPTPSQDLRTPSSGPSTNVPPTPPPSEISDDRQIRPVSSTSTPPNPPPSEASFDRSAPRPAGSVPSPPSTAARNVDRPAPSPPTSFDGAAPPPSVDRATPAPHQPQPVAQSIGAQAQPAALGERVEKESWTSNPLLLALAGFLVVLIVGGALVAAALAAADGGDEGGTGDTVVAGGDTTDDVAEVSTDDGSASTSDEEETTSSTIAGPTQSDLDGVVLSISDVPSGFTEGVLTVDDEPFCGLVPLVDPLVESGAFFESGEGASFVQELFTYDSVETATSVFARDMADVEGCPSSTFETSTGLVLDVAASVSSVGPLGDEAFGIRLILTSDDVPDVEIHVQVGNVRHGRTLSSFVYTTPASPTASEILLFNDTLEVVTNRMIENLPQ